MALTSGDIIKFIVAFFLPPLAVYMEKKDCDKDVLINLILSLLFWVPGILHAFYIILKY